MAMDGSTMLGRTLPWLIYPVTICLCLALHSALLAGGTPLLVSTYAALLLGAGLITYFEWRMPERPEWTGDRSSVTNDLLFMVLVQMIVPSFLSFLSAVLLVRWLGERGLTLEHLWVHEWPAGLQALLMVVIVDFLRYWLHVACHRVPFLWRLHSVHHSPPRLYWLNVGRFHPVEIALQFSLDSLPFILVGVTEEVLALYFVFHSVNGFFQHCNIRLRFGWLNYLISSAELHRWHHSKIIAESNSNYGNHFILWDWLFGTRFLPRGRQVGELGLLNPEFPHDFVSQMKTPFVDGIDHRRLPLGSWRDILLNCGLALHMRWVQWRLYGRIKRFAANPGAVQARVLQRITSEHRTTGFGKEHHFSDEMSLEQFRDQVGISDYERLRPYIERQDETGEPCLNSSSPMMYAVTSGTSGRPKYIPILEQTLKALSENQRLFACIQYRHCPDAFRGKILGIVSPAIEGRLPSGTPYGSASGFLYANMPRLARAKYALPPEVFEIADYKTRYYAILRLALPQRDITLMGSANPSTFLRLLDAVAENQALLLDDIENGTFQMELPPQLRGAFERHCHPDPGRAAELRALLSSGKPPSFAAIWPYLRLVTTWTGGNCGIALGSLKSRLPDDVCVMDLGFMASELRVSTTIQPSTNAGLPTFWENFFEFVERDRWERNEPEFLTLEQLKLKSCYYIFVTTPGGLFRYALNDIVEVCGHFHNVPTLRFLQKGIGCTSITGEKLYECQVLSAMRSLEQRLGFRSRFFQLLADEDQATYRLYLEPDNPATPDLPTLASALESELSKLNIEFRSKRESGRLQPCQVALLRSGTLSLYKEHSVALGKRETQLKIGCLRYRSEADFDLDAHTQAGPQP